ncbi:hypothetical protein HDU67_000642 [Dinochytrium kinnereticum]|nr:hypothetical protein HDU67_000642 [Dinochytrium kinnereticum]
MKMFIFVMLIAKIGFIANESVTGLKLLEKGFHKEDLALAVLIDFPFQILFGYYAAKWSSGPKPLQPQLPDHTVQFVGMGSFFTKISDPRIGGTYMTLLNTISNLGGTWPRFFVLKAVDYYTDASCSVSSADGSPLKCLDEHSKSICKSLEGTCETRSDGYYPVSIGCVVFGIITFLLIIQPQIKKIEALPESAWRLKEKDEAEMPLRGKEGKE